MITDGFLPQSSIDGIFGSQTKAAVIKLQSLCGITQDGIVGRATAKWMGIQ